MNSGGLEAVQRSNPISKVCTIRHKYAQYGKSMPPNNWRTQTIFSAPAPTTFRRVVTSQGTRCKSQVPTIQHHSQSRVMRRAFSATDHADSGGAARWMEWVLRLCRCTHTTWQETPGVSHRAHGSRPNGPVVGDSSRVVKDLTHTSLSCGIALSARGWQSETHLPQLKDNQEPAHFEPTCRK